MRAARTGFTLIEVALVLVIIGLIVGGVLTGQSLIRSSQLAALGKERSQFEGAVFAFKEKYLAWPGDMPNAFDFWGAGCGTNTTTISTGCNGDGDGSIENDENGENVKAWEHLVRAALIQGNYDGSGTVAGPSVELTTRNVPPSKFPQGYWDMNAEPLDADSISLPLVVGDGSVWLHWGTVQQSPAVESLAGHPTLTHGEAQQLDAKIDDGRASSGRMRGDNRADCVDSGADSYQLQTLGEAVTGDCVLHFVLTSNDAG